MKIEVKTSERVTTTRRVRLTGRHLLELLVAQLDDDIPLNASVTFTVPGGAD